ncbi:MAG: hypothetical protein K2X38_24115 [Gemmataceae bacterium]|nr:hypothetical protein [Gemmataceae bacterium]
MVRRRTTVELAHDRRDKLLAGNLLLVHRFVKNLPPTNVAAVGGHDEAVSTLMPIYITAVDSWLDRGERKGLALSTFVMKNLGWNWRKIFDRESFIVRLGKYQGEEDRPGMSQLEPGFEDLPASEDPDALGLDELEQLETAIAEELPENQALTIRYRYDGRDLTYRAIAKLMGISRTRVWQLERAALKRLRERLS